MYPILFSFSTHFSTLFINNSSIQNILSQDNLSQNKILLIFCAACFAGYFIAYIIGINPITGAVCTVLGIPGAILLYAIKIYSFL